MDVLMAAVELAPYQRETHAADAIAELSRGLQRLGHDVTVVLPRSPCFEERGLLVARRLTRLEVRDSTGAPTTVTVFDGQLASGVKLVLLDAPGLERAGVYGEGGVAYPDNALRFGLFGQAVAALIKVRAEHGQRWSALHLHDWPLAAVAPLVQREATVQSCVLTLHGEHSPTWSANELGSFGLDEAQVQLGQTARGYSPLKLGLVTADLVTVGSRQWAEHLRRQGIDGELSPEFLDLGERLIGIGEGIDSGVFNPATDTALPVHYDATEPGPKSTCKAQILRQCEFDFSPERPLIVASLELGDGRGFELLGAKLTEVRRQPCSLLLLDASGRDLAKMLGFGPPRETDTFRRWTSSSPEQWRSCIAAADLVLCLDQGDLSARTARIAQRYGTVPIAWPSAGHSDAIVDCDAALEAGTGFLADEISETALLGVIGRALSAYALPRFAALRSRIMHLDRSWERPLRRYVQLYGRASGL